MSLPLFPERRQRVPVGLGLRARAATAAALLLIHLPPARLTAVLRLVARGSRPATHAQVARCRAAVCGVSTRCRGRHCLERSVAVFLLSRASGGTPDWCSGFVTRPFTAHAWVEVAGVPVGEPEDVGDYRTVLAVRPHASRRGPALLLRQVLCQRRSLAVVTVLGLLTATASLAQPVVVGRVVHDVGEGRPVTGLVALLVVLLTATGVSSAVQHYVLQRMGETVVLAARRSVIERLFRLPIAEYDHRRVGDLTSRLTNDTSTLRIALTQGVAGAAGGLLTLVGAVVAMVSIDPLLFCLTLTTVLGSLAVVTGIGARIRLLSLQAQRVTGDLSAAAERVLRAIRTVRAANATRREEQVLDGIALRSWETGIGLARLGSLIQPVAGLATQVSLLVVLGVGGYRVASGTIDVAQLVSFVLFLFMMLMPLGDAFQAVTAVNLALGALARVEEIRRVPTEPSAGGRHDLPGPSRREPGPSRGEPVRARGHAPERPPASVGPPTPERPPASDEALGLVDVTFSYPRRTGEHRGEPAAPVLRGVRLSVRRGTRTALVGPSGAGKSTVLGLFEQFYEPTAGTVRYFGRDASSMSRVEIRSMIGYVEQNPAVLTGTLRDNLTLAHPDATDAECRGVLEAVDLAWLLDRGPHGLRTELGEAGVTLSGGERQRLAVARALLPSPPVLLLDESTSSLDGRNEQLLQDAIDAVSVGRTVVVVAHRLSTVADADTIIVLDQGRIVAQGTHSELLRTNPVYRTLARHQLLA